MNNTIYDVVGIGFGPSNLALAICMQEKSPGLTYHFIESQTSPEWQDQMLLEGSDIQNNPLRDLVTLRNPKSHYSFINYLKENGRLIEYLNLPAAYPLRREYAAYVRWVSNHFLNQVSCGSRVTHIDQCEINQQKLWKITTNTQSTVVAKTVVLGTGRSANIPAVFQNIVGDKVFHLTRYLDNIKKIPASAEKIAVLGASQSAVEILLDLMGRFPDKEIYSVQRSFGFRLKDTSAFSDRVYFPEFIDYYYNLSSASKQNIDRQLRATNYSSADGDVIDALYVKIYEERLAGKNRFRIINNTEIEQATMASSGQVILETKEIHLNKFDRLELDAVILATGFLDISSGEKGETCPPLLKKTQALLEKQENGAITVSRDYRVGFCDPDTPAIFLNGLCESTHGLGDAGSFSLVSLRSEVITDAITKVFSGNNVIQPSESLTPA